ncbi:DUF6491 family protein [Sphingosinicella rhizophila]|uniref:DUF6491 family protein n=1 Tax=Sphingosinicella rhizophila TaxID=3050082 RepID=A0ABU3Q869_9SPHN|nr:DUF6491 family protein [Sphingosinicella sp. GR2756]MDT9599492.1 DUF6491 family protein [Sphingosinicella sp. GR2756]
MKRMLLAGALLLAGCASEQKSMEVQRDDEARLASALAGYSQSGPPVSCVNSRDLQGNRSIGEHAIIFESFGNTLYVNRPRDGCPEITSTRALRTRTTSSRLCSGDLASVFDPSTGAEYGGCALGDFTPYRKAG